MHLHWWGNLSGDPHWSHAPRDDDIYFPAKGANKRFVFFWPQGPISGRLCKKALLSTVRRASPQGPRRKSSCQMLSFSRRWFSWTIRHTVFFLSCLFLHAENPGAGDLFFVYLCAAIAKLADFSLCVMYSERHEGYGLFEVKCRYKRVWQFGETASVHLSTFCSGGAIR